MVHYFPHEQLAVYGVALSYAARADELLSTWSSSWAVHGQFDRATESVVINLAQAARRRNTEAGVYSIECSLGSVLECAACLDVAFIRRLVDRTSMKLAKGQLRQIARMEVGLRRSWEICVREQSDAYGIDSERYFLHESLEVYQHSLLVHKALEAEALAKPLHLGFRVGTFLRNVRGRLGEPSLPERVLQEPRRSGRAVRHDVGM